MKSNPGIAQRTELSSDSTQRGSGKRARSTRNENVRIHIRCARTKCYLDSDDEWAEDPAHAKPFRSALEAELFCRQHAFADIELLVLRDQRPPLTIPIKLS